MTRARSEFARERERLAKQIARREQGASPRDKWLEENNREQRKPWVVLGMSRSTWYEKRRWEDEQ